MFSQSIRLLFVVIALSLIIVESKPNAKPQENEVQEVIIDELPDFEDDGPIDADSFPLAPDVHQSVGGVHDYHIRK